MSFGDCLFHNFLVVDGLILLLVYGHYYLLEKLKNKKAQYHFYVMDSLKILLFK